MGAMRERLVTPLAAVSPEMNLLLRNDAVFRTLCLAKVTHRHLAQVRYAPLTFASMCR